MSNFQILSFYDLGIEAIKYCRSPKSVCFIQTLSRVYQGVPDHPKVSPEPFSFTIVLCLKVLDSFGKMSWEDMKNRCQIMHLEPCWQINWYLYDFF